MNTQKWLSYAYPTSTFAAQAGYGKVGTYFVEIGDNGAWGNKRTLQHFGAERKAAAEFANSLPYAYGKYSLA